MGRGVFIGRVAALAGLVAVAAIAACAGPGPIVTETPSATGSAAPTASASASPQPLTDAELLALLPPEAASPDEDGARSAAEYFLSLYPELRRGSGRDVWLALSLPDCEFCDSSVENADKLLSEGTAYVGGEVSFDESKSNVLPVDGQDEYVMELHMRVAATETRYSDGTIEMVEPRTIVVRIQVKRIGEIWRTVGVALPQSGG